MAERDYIDQVNGDVVWSVTRFAGALGACIVAGLDQQADVQAAVDAVHREFEERSAGR